MSDRTAALVMLWQLTKQEGQIGEAARALGEYLIELERLVEGINDGPPPES